MWLILQLQRLSCITDKDRELIFFFHSPPRTWQQFLPQVFRILYLILEREQHFYILWTTVVKNMFVLVSLTFSLKNRKLLQVVQWSCGLQHRIIWQCVAVFLRNILPPSLGLIRREHHESSQPCKPQTSRAHVAVMIYTTIQPVLDLNLRRDTYNSDVFSWLSSVHPRKC
jgi:hypothetical protein